jgi:tRNA(fMet)-specific endonuclease VapC
MILLDTDTLSELMRPRPSSRLVARLEQVPAAEQATTSITLGEIAYGARKANRLELYDRAVGLLQGVKILDFDRAAAEQYGEVRLALERAGVRLADPDLRIAAIARAAGRLLVTGNVKHFMRVPGLRSEDWMRAARVR